MSSLFHRDRDGYCVYVCERERERGERERGEREKQKYDSLGFLMFTDVKKIVSQTANWN
jgi:hypothetical protein